MRSINLRLITYLLCEEVEITVKRMPTGSSPQSAHTIYIEKSAMIFNRDGSIACRLRTLSDDGCVIDTRQT